MNRQQLTMLSNFVLSGPPDVVAAFDAMVDKQRRLQTAFDRIALDPAEYRHALGHLAHCEDNCDACRRIAQQALDGGVDAQERAADILAERLLLQAVVRAVRDLWDDLTDVDADGKYKQFPAARYNAVDDAFEALDLRTGTE